jgi:hypothetical protein
MQLNYVIFMNSVFCNIIHLEINARRTSENFMFGDFFPDGLLAGSCCEPKRVLKWIELEAGKRPFSTRMYS